MMRNDGGSAIGSAAPLSTPLTASSMVAKPRFPRVIEEVPHGRV